VPIERLECATSSRLFVAVMVFASALGLPSWIVPFGSGIAMRTSAPATVPIR